jgi:hypothetical protein
VRTNERGPRFVKKERKKGPRRVNEREGHVVGTKERGPGCVNKREREREREINSIQLESVLKTKSF